MFNKNNKNVILALDGGGMKGAITASILCEMEKKLGGAIQDHIDFYVGTSTGAVIVSLLASGYSPQWILDNVYYDKFPKAFGNTGWPKYVRHVLNRTRNMYDLEKFTKAFEQEFSDRLVKDVVKPVLITTKDTRTGSNYFITNTGAGAQMFEDWNLLDAVTASAAAPIYFSAFEGIYSDGGVGAHNNPSMIGLIEAFNYFPESLGFTPDNTIVISIGTGHINTGDPNGSNKWGILAWATFLFREMFEDTSSFYPSALKSVFGSNLDYRRYNVDLSQNAIKELQVGAQLSNSIYEKFGLMRIPELKALLPDSTRPEQIFLMETVGRAYAKRIDMSIPNASPWDFPGGQKAPVVMPRSNG